MMKKHFIIGVLCPLLFFSCGQAPDVQAPDGATPRTLDVDLGKAERVFDMSSFLDTSFVSVIPLYTGPDCLMADDIDRFFIRSGKMVILEKRTSSVFIFRLDGSFVAKIHSLGGGPMDYVGISDVYATDDDIVLLDNRSRKVLLYGFDGEFRRYFRMDGWYGNSIFCRDDRIYYMNEWSVPPEGAYRLFSTDMEGKDLRKYLPFEQEKLRRVVKSPRQNYSFSGDKVHMIYPSTDTVYTLSADRATAEYALRFGDKSLPQKFWEMKYDELHRSGVSRSYVLGMENIYSFAGFLCLNFTCGASLPNSYNSLCDLSTGLVSVSHFLSGNYFGLKIFPCKFVADGYIVTTVTPRLFKSAYRQNPPAGPVWYNDRFNKVLAEADDEGNPIVILYKLKK